MRIVFTIIFSAIVIGILFWTRPDTHAELQSLPPPSVLVDQVKLTDIQPVTHITGRLQPARKASLHFQVSGQVDERFVEAGQYIEAGSVMLTIEAGDFEDAVKETQALLKTEQDAIERDSHLLTLMSKERELQEQQVARMKRLGQDSLASKSNYDQALQELYRQQSEEARLKHSVDSARSRLMIEQAHLNKAQRNLERTKLVAPFAGTVNTVHVEVGDYVSPGQSALELVQIDKLDLNLEITGKVASQLHLGQQIKIKIDNDQREGEIIALAVDPDPETNTHSLKIRLPSEGLYAGQLAVAEIPGQQYINANVIPIASILYEDGLPYIFEVIDDHVVQKPIELLERYQDLQIIKGVDSGTTIVSRDVSSLADGQKVYIR